MLGKISLVIVYVFNDISLVIVESHGYVSLFIVYIIDKISSVINIVHSKF